jgi:hypothetical protein
MGEAALPTNLTWSILGNLLRVVVMLFGNTMINSRMDFHGKSTLTHWLSTKGRVPNACVEGFGD